MLAGREKQDGQMEQHLEIVAIKISVSDLSLKWFLSVVFFQLIFAKAAKSFQQGVYLIDGHEDVFFEKFDEAKL